MEMSADEFSALMSKTQEIAKDILPALEANGCNILINTNEVAGQSVMHTHVHIIPRYDVNDTITLKFEENQFDLDAVLAQIKR